MKMKTTRILSTIGVAVASLALAACGGVSNTGGGGGNEGDPSPSAAGTDWSSCDMKEGVKDVSSTSGTGDDKTDITIGAFNGWAESFATSHLMKAILEEDGYTVKVQAFEAAPGFTGVAQGDIDVLTDAWLPITHESYLEKYGDKMENLGCWYDNAKLTIAVNDDSPAKSIADLKEMGDEYNNALIGIEAGAGLTKQTKEEAIPTYGLEDYDFKISSTPAMLAAIDKSQKDKENIAVTLWRPHWAYDAYPMRDLEDPEGAMGGTELVFNFARTGFSEEYPKASQLFKNMVIDDEHLSSLEKVMFSPDEFNGKDHDAAVKQWLEENPDFADQLRKGELG